MHQTALTLLWSAAGDAEALGGHSSGRLRLVPRWVEPRSTVHLDKQAISIAI